MQNRWGRWSLRDHLPFTSSKLISVKFYTGNRKHLNSNCLIPRVWIDVIAARCGKGGSVPFAIFLPVINGGCL